MKSCFHLSQESRHGTALSGAKKAALLSLELLYGRAALLALADMELLYRKSGSFGSCRHGTAFQELLFWLLQTWNCFMEELLFWLLQTWNCFMDELLFWLLQTWNCFMEELLSKKLLHDMELLYG